MSEGGGMAPAPDGGQWCAEARLAAQDGTLWRCMMLVPGATAERAHRAACEALLGRAGRGYCRLGPLHQATPDTGAAILASAADPGERGVIWGRAERLDGAAVIDAGFLDVYRQPLDKADMRALAFDDFRSPALAIGPAPGPLRSYFLTDARLREKVEERFDLLRLPVPCVSLFQGKAQRDLERAAPYLIDVTLPEGGEAEPLPAFQGRLLRLHMAAGTGSLIRSRAPLEVLRAHLRHFTRLPDGAGRWRYFRFWDPVVGHYLWHWMAATPPLAAALGAGTSGQETAWPLIEAVHAPAGEQVVSAVFPSFARGGAPLRLGQHDMPRFRAAREAVFVRTIVPRLCEEDPGMALRAGGPEQVAARVAGVVGFATGHGIYREENLARIVRAQIATGFGRDLPQEAALALGGQGLKESDRTEAFLVALRRPAQRQVLRRDDLRRASA